MNYAIDKKVAFPCEITAPKHTLDAGRDIRWGYDFDVDPGQLVKIDTGISVDIPDGWFIWITPRSSNTTLTLANESGIIDSTYTGNIILKVQSKNTRGKLNIFEEQKHFQMICVPHMVLELNKVDKITKDTARGDGGFGSTN